MNNDVIMIPFDDEVEEKISLENILPAHKNFNNPLAFNENIFKYIDSLQNAEILKEELLKISNVRIKKFSGNHSKNFLPKPLRSKNVERF